jgi:hypothetical protein
MLDCPATFLFGTAWRERRSTILAPGATLLAEKLDGVTLLDQGNRTLNNET